MDPTTNWVGNCRCGSIHSTPLEWVECKGGVAPDPRLLAEKSDPLERVEKPVVTEAVVPEAYAVLALVRAGWTLTPPKGKA